MLHFFKISNVQNSDEGPLLLAYSYKLDVRITRSVKSVCLELFHAIAITGQLLTHPPPVF